MCSIAEVLGLDILSFILDLLFLLHLARLDLGLWRLWVELSSVYLLMLNIECRYRIDEPRSRRTAGARSSKYTTGSAFHYIVSFQLTIAYACPFHVYLQILILLLHLLPSFDNDDLEHHFQGLTLA